MIPTWIIHFIHCGQVSYHTHGLNAYGSLELELNLPLEPNQGSVFINLIANEIAEKGKRYRSGDREDDVFNLPVYLFETTPIRPSGSNDRVLRILFCDPAGRYPWESGCEGMYSRQLNVLEKKEMATLLHTRKNGDFHAGPN